MGIISSLAKKRTTLALHPMEHHLELAAFLATLSLVFLFELGICAIALLVRRLFICYTELNGAISAGSSDTL